MIVIRIVLWLVALSIFYVLIGHLYIFFEGRGIVYLRPFAYF